MASALSCSWGWKLIKTYHISKFGTKWDIIEESARWEVRCIRGKTHLRELLQCVTTTRFVNTFSNWHPHPSCWGTSQTASGYFHRKGQGIHLSCEWFRLYFVTSGYVLEPGTESWRVPRLWSTQSSHCPNELKHPLGNGFWTWASFQSSLSTV